MIGIEAVAAGARMLGWWLHGIARTRPWRSIGAIAAVAATVALMAVLYGFVHASGGAMTRRAISSVPVDWQVELLPGMDPQAALAALADGAPIARHELVAYATVEGFEASTRGTVQVTGAGQVLGLPSTYAGSFPGQIRMMAGKPGGVLVAQQTAANLHVGVGDTIAINRAGMDAAHVVVVGIVDLPNAVAMFQTLGRPAGAEPQAAPDNVVILPVEAWQELFASQSAPRSGVIRRQLHAMLDRSALPADPLAAYRAMANAGRKAEVGLAGRALLGNNLAAKLDASRADALYAALLVLFLGLPCLVLSAFLVIGAAAAGADLRRRDVALLRLRGAVSATVGLLVAGEALAIWGAGAILGLTAAVAMLTLLLDDVSLDAGFLAAAGVACGISLLITLAAFLVPAWLQTRSLTVNSARRSLAKARRALWRIVHLDLVLLALAALAFWETAASGYQIVLAAEGVASTSVDYWSFLAPTLAWGGAGLFSLRAAAILSGRGRGLVERLIRPFAGSVGPIVVASLSRQRRRLAIGTGLTALAVAFATSTAIFNLTYRQQAEVDAYLTNGADVTVSGSAGHPAGAFVPLLSKVPGIGAIQPMQHRYAYVGSDLQDLYGIDASRLADATALADSYFGNGDARRTLAILAQMRDGILVSDETMADFQLSLGDTINLRLRRDGDGELVTIRFTVIGVVREFPTAPRDSFLVANADYVAKGTGSAAETVLIKARSNSTAVAAAVRQVLAAQPDLGVSEVGQTSAAIASSLTAVSIDGLARIERPFAILGIVGAAGLVFGLGLADRRRTFAILNLLGASGPQIAAFICVEAALVLVMGATIGLATGSLVAGMLVRILQGVFDPPPDAMAVPWAYIGLVVFTAAASAAVAAAVARRDAAISPIAALKDAR